jgi:exosome complex RNA-binding protein Rrp4
MRVEAQEQARLGCLGQHHDHGLAGGGVHAGVLPALRRPCDPQIAGVVVEAPVEVDAARDRRRCRIRYLKPGDAILCKILFVDEQKKVQVTLKDRNLSKLEGGELMEVPPVKVARVIGKNGSMLNLLKEYVECWLYVGQNGRVWLNGEPEEVLLAKQTIQKVCDEAHLPGLTDRIRAFLEARKPGGADTAIATEEE